ncbi:hypothetical protein GCM10022393_35940 [Aquimarina addita]|uniref:EF-hand domain-containing protein n=1 Tax=Aquimarina addita TaxID=870485 RepID=A0ABP6UQX0_9FLAO
MQTLAPYDNYTGKYVRDYKYTTGSVEEGFSKLDFKEDKKIERKEARGSLRTDFDIKDKDSFISLQDLKNRRL